MAIHQVAAAGYATCGDAYERGRPGYPADALREVCTRLRIGPGSVLLEVGAGTGKLTRLLVHADRTVVAVEPVQAMLRHLTGAVPGALAVAGTAEAIPLRARSVDAVVVGTAFHWFDGDRALEEIRRVLRPGGGLALLWNNPDRDHRWVARAWEIIDRHRSGTPGNRDLRWRDAFRRTSGFTALRHERFSHEDLTDLDGLRARVASISFIAALPEGARQEVLAQVADVASSDPIVARRGVLVLPYRTDVYWCRAAGEEGEEADAARR
ncbi:MAG TPA: methyltransferase domain-containing protein [Egibacteraceae bacterium]|nr:methyltransferase domain-containing protein [Egibacteraceae bacterium]